MAAQLLGDLKFPLGQVLKHIGHLVFVGHVSHERLGDAHEGVNLLEQAGCHEAGLEGLVAVDGVHHALADLPQRIRVIGRRCFEDFLPILDVVDEDLVGGVEREGARCSLGIAVSDAPGIHDVELTVRGHGVAKDVGPERDFHELVGVDETIGVSIRLQGLSEVFFCCEHLVPSLSVGALSNDDYDSEIVRKSHVAARCVFLQDKSLFLAQSPALISFFNPCP